MNKLAHYCLFLILLAGSVTCSLAQQANSPSPTEARKNNEQVWQEFSPPDGGFTVLMPGKPEEQNSSLNTPSGQIPIYAYVLKTSDAQYVVTYSDSPVPLNNEAVMQKRLDAGRDQMLAGNKANLMRQIFLSTIILVVNTGLNHLMDY